MKEIPKFKSENEEQQFWSEHDSTEFVDWSKARRGVFPNLKPSTKTISLVDLYTESGVPEHFMIGRARCCNFNI